MATDARWSYKANPSDHAKGPMTLQELQRLIKKSFVSFDELISDGGSQWLEIGDVAVLEDAVRGSICSSTGIPHIFDVGVAATRFMRHSKQKNKV
jgi:hypothetical protein